MTSREEQIKIVINEMDFNKIKSVMDFLGWTWKCDADGRRVPTIQELKIAAVHCINQAWRSEDNFYNSGGFECEIVEGMVELRFVIEKANPLSKIFG